MNKGKKKTKKPDTFGEQIDGDHRWGWVKQVKGLRVYLS